MYQELTLIFFCLCWSFRIFGNTAHGCSSS